MKRISIILILALLCWLPFGFAQTPAVVAEKQDPLKDSIDKYTKMGQYAKALPFSERWAEKLKKEKGEESVEFGGALSGWGNALNQSGKSKEAEPILLMGLKIRTKTLGENHVEVAKTLNYLGILYFNMGDYYKAETYYLQSLEVRKKVHKENHKEVASSLLNLGTLYMKMGDYSKAETYYLQSLEMYKKEKEENNPDIAMLLNNLGCFYIIMGNYPKAETYCLEALQIWKKTLSDNHPNLAMPLMGLGDIQYYLGNFAKAEPYYLYALVVLKKALGDNHPNVANLLNNMGALYWEMDNYAKAEYFYLQALEKWKIALGENHHNVATSLNNLGNFYREISQFSKGEPYLLKALEIRKKALGENHPDVSFSVSRIGTFHFTLGQMEKAEVHYLDWNAKKQVQIQRYFPFLSDNERNQFYENTLSPDQEIFKSFCLSRYHGKKAISGDFYNDQLATKGLLLNNSAKWKHRIKTAGDKKLNRLFDEWETNQNKLNKLFQSTDSTERAGIDSVERKTEKMEKELSLRSENFAKLADKKLINWKDVQKALKPGEAAVEIVRVKKFGIEKTVTDTSDPKKAVYKVKGLTDTIYYAALIVKPESTIPEMVVLKNGNDMEGKYLKYYQNLIKNKLDDNKSYQQFWQKIGAKLEGSKSVFFSPDGVYHNLNLNTLFNPKTKKYLLEEKDIRIVTVTKDIVNPSPVEEDNKLAELVGFPSYYTNQTGQIAAVSERKSPELIYGLSLKSTGSLAELPGTKTEVDKIAGILTEKGWEVKNYTGSTALEENIKESYKPRLLHVATHGFFQPDTTKGSNPLLRSGLMLTGAGNTLKGEKYETGEDGILTAYEAMNLNLDNTDLVVLSACETGLGEIKNGEGVYGLQRAFKVAGAKSIIMSLWKVDDEATQELMVSFYKHWLGPTQPPRRGGANTTNAALNPPLRGGKGGATKRSAFLKAQKELKAKYPNPYYWGAFVMVGE